MDSELAYPATNLAMVAKVAIFDRLNAGQDRGFDVLVMQLLGYLSKSSV